MGNSEPGSKCSLHFLWTRANAWRETHYIPPVIEINASLERIQGDLRKMIDEFRAKAIELRN